VIARPQVVLAVDIGTTSAKAGLVALDGSLLGVARAGYEMTVGHRSGWAEQDPDAWWTALVTTARELLDRTAVDVVAICVDGHGPTLAAVDAGGQPTRSAITWLDSRARDELDELSADSGLRGWALGVLPAALWVERNERGGVAAKTRWYLNTWEFVELRLTGRAATTIVPGQSLPDPSLLRNAGLPPEKVAPVVGAGEVVGGLAPAAAEALGLAAGTSVVAGVVDAFASFHGAGLLEPGDAIDTGGMSGGFGVYWSRPIEAQGSFCTPGPLDGTFVVGGAMAATGRALDWLREDLLGGTIALPDLLDEAAQVPAGSDGLVFLPYLAGERSPIWDPTARGAFAGLTLGHGRAHLARAVLEAAAFAIRHVASPILEQGVRVTEMRVCGGPAHSALWNEIKADVTGFTVAVPHALETAVVGSAIVGAVGIGAYADLPSAIRAMTRIDRRHAPRAEVRATYERTFEAYVALHPLLSQALASIRGPGPVQELQVGAPDEVAATGARG
jgi:xylulokinase